MFKLSRGEASAAPTGGYVAYAPSTPREALTSWIENVVDARDLVLFWVTILSEFLEVRGLGGARFFSDRQCHHQPTLLVKLER